MNDGECFMIETLAGNNKHCRCKDGYQGVRCDQYLPKTDSILSDPTEHLGIEFMESQELYQRQILSITCITIGLMVVGMLCVVLYCKTRKQRQKLRDEARELRYSKSYSLQPSPLSGPGLILPPQLQPHRVGQLTHTLTPTQPILILTPSLIPTLRPTPTLTPPSPHPSASPPPLTLNPHPVLANNRPNKIGRFLHDWLQGTSLCANWLPDSYTKHTVNFTVNLRTSC
uniref:EGF-like domain-containing protein n=1 Tax=Callorhinchus milii TaxID=7868 RepID=A0A4W3JUJ1_CALMI